MGEFRSLWCMSVVRATCEYSNLAFVRARAQLVIRFRLSHIAWSRLPRIELVVAVAILCPFIVFPYFLTYLLCSSCHGFVPRPCPVGSSSCISLAPVSNVITALVLFLKLLVLIFSGERRFTDRTRADTIYLPAHYLLRVSSHLTPLILLSITGCSKSVGAITARKR
jgi:hypothetical protein